MVTLQPIAATDAPAIAAAVQQSSDALRRWMAWHRDDYDVGTTAACIDASLAAAAKGHGAPFAVLDASSTVIGVVGFEDISERTGRAMIGYWLTTAATGRVIGRQAVAFALDWAQARTTVSVVWAVVADANLASRRVLEANRFSLVGPRGADERNDLALLYELELRPPVA
jgi:RimJ/RimL family protein N-acetyltransferase